MNSRYTRPFLSNGCEPCAEVKKKRSSSADVAYEEPTKSDNGNRPMPSALSDPEPQRGSRRQGAEAAANGSHKPPDSSAGSSRRPGTAQPTEPLTPSVIVEEFQRSQIRDQRRVAVAAVVACSAILIIFIVMAYVIVSNRSKPPPARNATPAAVSPAQLSALQRQSSAGTTTHRPSQLCTSRNRTDLQPQRT
ncbi:hypothetical protein HPB51_004993 [Rhipicephalus microplus]|uniref:Uncharacterized protein n=1 Tax=Rhipicephalus microplus TaxID=6941 RepID=A0A9J6EXX3_RHIMP|nr:hypothetical protein HPB51_004993 [Rhipicephalus microplus]